MTTPKSLNLDLTRSQILRGDCIEVIKRLPDASVDAVVTDPPYASLAATLAADRRDASAMYSGGSRRAFPTLAGAGMSPVYFGRWLESWMRECARVLKPGGTFFCFMDWRGLPAVCEEAAFAGLMQTGIFVWHKTASRPVKGAHKNSCEYVFVGKKSGKNAELCSEVCGGGFFASSNVPNKYRKHLTQKPLALMKELMCVIPFGAIVLDPFAGSGSTVVACEQTGRVGIGIEVTPEYAEVAERRLKEAQEKGSCRG